MMETRLNIEENKGTITAYEDGTAVGDLTFKIRSEGIIVITHTLAFEGNESKGIGATLMEAAVRYALENDKKIVPLCSYARHYLERKPGLQSLISD